jgi:hypothetical protein
VLYHLSGFNCFQYYYERLVLGEMKSYFPGAILIASLVAGLSGYLFLRRMGAKNELTEVPITREVPTP